LNRNPVTAVFRCDLAWLDDVRDSFGKDVLRIVVGDGFKDVECRRAVEEEE
jgi:hypothetical protein